MEGCRSIHWLDEFSGSVANFGIIFPLMVGVSFATGLHLGTMLLVCGVWYILIGIWYGIPLSVEPLKAIGALAIGYELSSVDILTSGVVLGAVMLLLGMTGGMQYISNLIPQVLVRGIQFALGLILLRTAVLSYGTSDPWFFGGALVLIVLCGALAKWRNIPDFSALLLIAIACGFALAMGWLVSGADAVLLQLPPLFHPELFSIPVSAWTAAVIPGLSSQLPLTITNSVLATALLVSDLYKRPVSSNSLACSVGLMSVSSSILGGFPMCHGAGGVAAHHHFGAKTGVSMVIGGVILFVLALFLSSEAVFHFLSFGILAALLVVVSVELMRRGFSDSGKDGIWLIVCMGAIALFAGMTFAFIAGCAWVLVSRLADKKRPV